MKMASASPLNVSSYVLLAQMGTQMPFKVIHNIISSESDRTGIGIITG